MSDGFFNTLLGPTAVAASLGAARALPLALWAPLLGRGLTWLPVRLGAAILLGFAAAPRVAPVLAGAYVPALITELLIGGVFALGVSVAFSAVRAGMSLAEARPERDDDGPLSKLLLASAIAAVALSGGLNLVATGFLGTYDIVGAWDPAAALAGNSGPLAAGTKLFSLALMLALPLLAVQFVIDLASLATAKIVPAMAWGNFGAGLKVCATTLFAALAVLETVRVVAGMM
jgi:flagellar biosynthesis protein FliR